MATISATKKCDGGGWYCVGQYPPALAGLLAQKRDFQQLEDFNKKKDEHHEEYQKKYHAAMSGAKIPESSYKNKQNKEDSKASTSDSEQDKKAKTVKAAQDAAKDPANWADTADTTRMWNSISSGDVESLEMWLSVDPAAAFIRASDGRGPLWWAHEYHQKKIISILLAAGVDEYATDVNGVKPGDLS